jgi:hypothetical protein
MSRAYTFKYRLEVRPVAVPHFHKYWLEARPVSGWHSHKIDPSVGLRLRAPRHPAFHFL